MKFLFSFLLSIVLLACTQLPKAFEKEKRGIRHTASQALYPHKIGNYAFLGHDEFQALQAEENGGSKSTALYLDYQSGGEMTSILYRPFAKIETFKKPKNVKFEDFVKQEIQKLILNREVSADFVGHTGSGTPFRQVKFKNNQAFMSQGFSGMEFNEKLPAITKLVFLDKGTHVIFMTTSYPSNGDETLARPNTEFVNKFLEMQR